MNALHTTLAAAGQYGTGGLKQWIQDNVITVVVLIAGVSVLWAARGGNIAKGVTIGAGVLIGLAVIGLATGNNASDIGTFFIDLFKS